MFIRSLVTLLLSGLASGAFAAEPFPAPVGKPKVPEPRRIPAQKLPEEVRAQIAQISEGPLQAADIEVIELDLNADGEKEMLVLNPMSYTGGQLIWMFASRKAVYRSIGSIQGEFYLASPVDGWSRIVADSRAPGGFIRVLSAFENGAYVSVREAEFSTLEDGKETYVGELTPRR